MLRDIKKLSTLTVPGKKSQKSLFVCGNCQSCVRFEHKKTLLPKKTVCTNAIVAHVANLWKLSETICKENKKNDAGCIDFFLRKSGISEWEIGNIAMFFGFEKSGNVGNVIGTKSESLINCYFK